MDSVTENWKPVKGFEGMYEVSDEGRVKALPCEHRHWCGRMIPQPERLITLTKHTGGYRMVALKNEQRGGIKKFVHRLVMEAFVGDGSGRDVNHIDGDKTNNHLANLEYCDRLHNVRHAIRTGLQNNAGEGNGMHKLTAEEVIAAHAMVARGSSCLAVASQFGVTESCIDQIVKGVRWKHLGLPALT